MAGTCLDQEQNAIDCADPNCTYGDCTDQLTTPPSSGSLLAQVQAAQTVGTPTGTLSPVAVASASSGSGGAGIFASILNFGSSVIKSVSPTSSTTGLVLKTNPATGAQQYFNPTTGVWVGGPVNNASSGISGIGGLFSGSSGLILVVVALAVAFFAFGFGRKRTA